MLTPADIHPALLQQAADELEIAVPIRAWEVQKGKLILHLAYGRQAEWTPDQKTNHHYTPENTPIPDNLSSLLKPELKRLARIHQIDGWSRMRKAQLVEALRLRRNP